MRLEKRLASRNMTLIHNTVFFRSIRGPHETRGEAGLQEYDPDMALILQDRVRHF